MSSMEQAKPNFLFIGPDKAGSTWLYNALSYHDEVFLSKAKELFFFDQFYDRGWQWYGSYFRDSTDRHRVIGEISHDYLFSRAACERIKRDIPSAKLMICLREPVQRAFSAYLYMIKQGRIEIDFNLAIREVEELIDHGCYAKHLEPFLQTFGREQIHVALFDDLVANSQVFFDGVCDFLEISQMRLPERLTSKANAAMQPRVRGIAGLARKAGWQVRRFGLPGLVGRVKESPIVKRLLYKNFDPEHAPLVDDDARSYIRKQVASDVARLDLILGTDFGIRWGYRSNAK
jgi:hypothetical protein